MISKSDAHPHPNYGLIFGVLLALTVVTVVISRIHLGFAGNMALAVAVATVKGLLVAMYFMHLKFEKKHLVIAVAIPLFFVAAFIIGLLPDIVFGRM